MQPSGTIRVGGWLGLLPDSSRSYGYDQTIPWLLMDAAMLFGSRGRQQDGVCMLGYQSGLKDWGLEDLHGSILTCANCATEGGSS